MLWFGWFGFNAGSSFGANALAANAFMVTQIAAAVAGTTWAVMEQLTHGKPTTLATLREAVHVIRELANGRPVEYKGATIRFPWAGKSRVEVWVAGYGPKALQLIGEVGDGFILQLADPDIAAWTISSVRAAAEAAGRDPDAIFEARVGEVEHRGRNLALVGSLRVEHDDAHAT